MRVLFSGMVLALALLVGSPVLGQTNIFEETDREAARTEKTQWGKARKLAEKGAPRHSPDLAPGNTTAGSSVRIMLKQ